MSNMKRGGMQGLAAPVMGVIPLYNGAHFIRQMLESVLNQTEPADELIVDEESPHTEVPIVEGDGAPHPVTLLRRPNGAWSSAGNLAVRHTARTRVAFLAPDKVRRRPRRMHRSKQRPPLAPARRTP